MSIVDRASSKGLKPRSKAQTLLFTALPLGCHCGIKRTNIFETFAGIAAFDEWVLIEKGEWV
jgi:hypothetical protein